MPLGKPHNSPSELPVNKSPADDQQRRQETEYQRQRQAGKDDDDTEDGHSQDEFPDQEVRQCLEGMLVAERGTEMGRGLVKHIARFPAALADLAFSGRVGI